MRIKANGKQYWVYWNYQCPKSFQLITDPVTKHRMVKYAPDTRNVITTCFILDDSIRMKNPDGSFTGLDNLLVRASCTNFRGNTKLPADRHCKATARAYSLNKAALRLFGDDIESHHNFNVEVEKSQVRFVPNKPKLNRAIKEFNWLMSIVHSI